jgi:hypothetical protein
MRVNAAQPRDVTTSVLASHDTDSHTDGIVGSRETRRALD